MPELAVEELAPTPRFSPPSWGMKPMTAGPKKAARYDYLVDPSDCYLIWDRATDLPCFDGCILAY